MPGPSNAGQLFQRSSLKWVNLTTHDHQVKVKRDPWNRSLVAIELQANQRPLKVYRGSIRRFIDVIQDLDFVAQLDPHTGEWIAVAPMSAEFAANVPRLSKNDQRDRPYIIPGNGQTK